MFNPYAPPRGKSALIASLTPDRDDLPSLDSLNPDNLKDLTKEVLSDLLKAHNVIPGGSKPEMKKQVRTLIHSINSNTPLPTSIQMPKGMEMGADQLHQFQQLQNQQHELMQGVVGQAPMMNPLSLQFQQPYNPMSFVPQTAAPPPPYLVTSPMSQHQMQSQFVHTVSTPQPPPMSYPGAPNMGVGASVVGAPSTPQTADRTERASAKSAKETTSSSGHQSAGSPPPSPKHHEESDTCKDCTKKANKECTNHRCRGCCLKYMVESKDLCLIHIKDESRRPRTKEHPNAELQSLIAQAQATFPGFSVSTSNTPATATPTMASAAAGGNANVTEPLSLGVSPLMIGGKPHHLAPPPPLHHHLQQQHMHHKQVSNIAMPAVPTGTMHPAAGANTAQQLASTHKVQTQLQMKLVNEAAHYAQQIAFHRMTMRKDDQAAFYSCPRCDKVLGVNGSQLWRHVQSEHPDLFVPLLKQNIYNGGLVGDQSDILSLSKEAAQERINTTAQWLKELFSPSLLLNSNNSNVNNSDKDNDHTRLEKIKGYESRLESLVQSFDHRISTSIESIQSDSNLFYQFYNQLSEVNTIDELENLTKQYEKVKNIHFSPKPLLITPILNQQSQPGVNNDLIIQQL